MKAAQTIKTRSGFDLVVETATEGGQLEVIFRAPALGKRCLLHWGLRASEQGGWTLPPPSAWPPETQASGPNAARTPFSTQNERSEIVIRLGASSSCAAIEFDLFFPEDGRWDNNDRRNYQVRLAETAASPLAALRAQTASEEVSFERVFDLEPNRQLAVAVTKSEAGCRVWFSSNLPEPAVSA
jgi:hypothetical protein